MQCVAGGVRHGGAGVGDRLQEQGLPGGAGESPGPGGPTVKLAVVCPLRTGNVPVADSAVDTVSLFPALGWLPPLLKH